MKCFFCKNLLSDYVDGVLDGQLENEIKAHLGICRECSQYFSDLKHSYKMLKRVKPLDPGDTFYDLIKKQIIGNTWFNKTYRRLFVPASVKVPLILLISFTVVVITSFALVERNKLVYLSKVNLDMFQPSARENSLSPKQKGTLRNFAKTISTELTTSSTPSEIETVKPPMPTIGPSVTTRSGKSEEGPLVNRVNAIANGKGVLERERIPDENLNANNLIFKIFLNSPKLAEDTKSILDIIKTFDISKASSAELGVLEEEGAYFHLYIAQNQYENLVAIIKKNFKITIIRAESQRVVTGNRFRVIIWIQNVKKP